MKLYASLVVVTIQLAVSGCALLKSPEAKTVVDLAFAKCVAEAESTDARVVAALCKAGPDLYAILTELLAAKKAAMAKAGVCKPAPVSLLCKPPLLYNSALQICMGDLGYKAAYVDSYGVTQ